jgi:SAM-dependent methyltransferase
MTCVTNYSRIYDRYDANPDRHRIAVDAEIRKLLERAGRAKVVRVLDLACGTGNWLTVQMKAYATQPVEWHGLDACEDMLGLARAKVPAARLVAGRAEHLPYADRQFDLVAVNFAFHHFDDKDAVLDEIVRVLAPAGIVRMNNVAPEQADHWWVYRYFPAAVAIDCDRFWPVERIVAGLAVRGIACEVEFTLDDHLVRLAVLLDDARRRDISELDVIPDEAYEAGLTAMARDLGEAPASEVASGLPLYSLVGNRP